MTAVGLASAGITAVDLGLYPELQRYGATDVSACFSCGTCTASCPLSQTDSTFPRRIIRYAQVGMKDALLTSKELWSCYQCGECAETCPTQADPSEFMAAARRYAIASYDRTRIARTMYTRPLLGTAFAVFVAMFFALFMYSAHGPQSGESLAIFAFIPEELIHNTGIVVMILVALAGLSGVTSMARGIARREGVGWRSLVGSRPAMTRSVRAAWSAVARESLGQDRFRKECETDALPVAWYRRRWLLHAVTVWGFLGLFAATLLDYGFALIGLKATGTPVPIWYPIRLLGTVAGVMLIYGVTSLIVERYRARHRSVKRSTTADWMLLGLALGHRRHRVHPGAGPLPAECARLGLLGLPRPRRGRHGADAPRPVHEARARGLPTRCAVLRRAREIVRRG